MSIVKFTGTVLPNINKKGILTPDANGYYTFIVGGLNCFNSAGEYYTAKGATQLFENSSHLMRRISNGALFGELGHPKKDPSMSADDFYKRVFTLEEKNICCHFSEVWLDFAYGRNNPQVNNTELVAIMAKVKPSGPHASALESSITNTQENVAFSIRGITENKYRNGRVERTLTQIVTWDRVIEPGINIANKWASPVLEELSDVYINTDKLLQVAKNNQTSSMASEDSHAVFREVIEKYTIKNKPSTLMDW